MAARTGPPSHCKAFDQGLPAVCGPNGNSWTALGGAEQAHMVRKNHPIGGPKAFERVFRRGRSPPAVASVRFSVKRRSSRLRMAGFILALRVAIAGPRVP